jgi:hypothetical protein
LRLEKTERPAVMKRKIYNKQALLNGKLFSFMKHSLLIKFSPVLTPHNF